MTERNVAVRAEAGTAHVPAWRVLLPVEPAGPVVLVDLPPALARGLRRTFPRAVELSREARPGAVIWDGRRAPLLPGSAALAVVDARGHPGAADALAGVRAPDGVLAALIPSRRGRAGDYALYPSPGR